MMYGVLSFLWKHNTFLAVYCTLFIYVYFYKNNNTKKRGKKKEEKKEWSKIRTRHLRLDATTPTHYNEIFSLSHHLIASHANVGEE